MNKAALAGCVIFATVQTALASSGLPQVEAPVRHRETAEARARKKQLAAHPYWLRLLHYRGNLIGRYQSEIDDPAFFLSPKGRQDPQAELTATIKAFAEPDPEDPYQ